MRPARRVYDAINAGKDIVELGPCVRLPLAQGRPCRPGAT